MRITLLQRRSKIPSREFTGSLQNSLNKLKSDLTVTATFTGFSPNGWATVDVDGPDSEIFLQLISRELGIAKTEFQSVERDGNYPGQVSRFDHNLEVDLGVESPDPVTVIVKLSSLRAQLTDGNPVPAKEIQDTYGLYPGSTVEVRITEIDEYGPSLQAWLADSQMQIFSDWVTSGVDRVQIFNCTREELESAIRTTRLERDIISSKSITLTTHIISCKLGTDGIGLIPKLGAVLRQSQLKPILPKRINAINSGW